jgi:transcriptional regulator with XRE-family HTH domain
VPYISEEGKITLRELKRRHNLSTYALAAIANVEPGLIYWMEQGGALPKKDVENILLRLSQVTGQDYSMETVGGYWIKEDW